MTGSLLPLRDRDHIVPGYRGTPIADLLAYHNLALPQRACDQAGLLVGMCMDHRQRVRIPDRFAYIMHVGEARILRLEFHISFAVAIGGVQAIAVVGHDQCGMVDLGTRRQAFIRGVITKAGWSRRTAETHFVSLAVQVEIGDAIVSILREAAQLRQKYPAVAVAPLMYRLSDGLLYQVDETRGEKAPR